MSRVVLTQPHNQAKSWEYFRDFIAAMGIYFLVSQPGKIMGIFL